jgi:hypothetical protein
MPLPPRPFHCLNDIAIRWSVMPLDIVGWATGGMISLSIIVPPVRTAASELVSGIVEVAGAEVFPLFRRDGSAIRTIKLRRIRPAGGTEWEWITDPSEGVTASAADILITRAEAERFERQHGGCILCSDCAARS